MQKFKTLMRVTCTLSECTVCWFSRNESSLRNRITKSPAVDAMRDTIRPMRNGAMWRHSVKPGWWRRILSVPGTLRGRPIQFRSTSTPFFLAGRLIQNRVIHSSRALNGDPVKNLVLFVNSYFSVMHKNRKIKKLS